MRKNINRVTLCGRVYQLGSNDRDVLSLKTVQNESSKNYGGEFIGGTIQIATDDEGLNIVPVHFSYVTATTSAGKPNATFNALKRIIESGKTWVNDGPENATCVRISTALGLNEFVNQQDNSLVCAKRCEGGFVTILAGANSLPAKPEDRNCFELDMVVDRAMHIEADPEKNIEQDYMKICGNAFDFRGALLPADLNLYIPEGVAFFDSIADEITTSHVLYTHFKGQIVNRSVQYLETVDGAFGTSHTKEVSRKQHEWVINYMNTEPYDFGDPEVMTAEDLTTARQNREIAEAEIRKRDADYRASRNNGVAQAPATNAAAAPASNGFTSGIQRGKFNF